MAGSAFAALCLTSAGAMAQQAANSVESVVVTGTLIRGVAPVGSSLIALDRSALEQTGGQTIAQMLGSVPAITGFGTGGNEFRQGAFAGSGANLPTIHGLGASSSQSTLILVDGHQITPSDKDGYSDPGSIPTQAIQRIDVLPGGASATYGANAVAGVINFITYRNYEGADTKINYGFANGGYSRFTFSQILGHQWDSGGFYGVYEYKSSSSLVNANRSFSAHQDLRPLGGTNYNSFNCSPATVGVGADLYQYPYGAGNNLGPSKNVDAAQCDYKGVNPLIPSLSQNTVWMSFNQEIGDWLTVRVDADFSSRLNANEQSQSTLTATAFGPTGSSGLNGTNSRNPFYVAPPGGSTASQTVRWDPTDMIGPVQNKVGARTAYVNTEWVANLPYEWTATFSTVSGWNDSFTHAQNQFCGSCAALALNGTTSNSGGSVGFNSLADPYSVDTTTVITRTLSSANALDVWNPAGSANRTSRSVIQSISSDVAREEDTAILNDVHLNFQGPLFQLPGGPLRVAIGGEWQQLHMEEYRTSSNGALPTMAGAATILVPMARTVYSAFMELYAPLIGPEQDIPLVKSFELDLAGRYDSYNDVGITKNPKIGFTWQMLDGLTWKGSFGTSFTAPNIDALNPIAIGSVGPQTSNFTVPATHLNYAGSFCTVIAGPCVVNSATMQGVGVNGGNANLVPARGRTYSFGMDFDAGQLFGLQGLGGNVTYWQATILGGVTRPPLDNVITIPALQNLLLLAPPGGWAPTDPAVVNAISGFPITSPLPSRVYYIYMGLRENAVNIKASGIDLASHYTFDTGSDGIFTIGASGSWTLRYDLAGTIGAPYQNFLNGHQNASVLHSLGFTGRMSFEWNFDPFDISLFYNYANPYWYPNTSTRVPTGLAPEVGAVGGGMIYDKVSATQTVDLHAVWNLPTDSVYGFGQGLALSLDVTNIFNTNPPFLDTPDGSWNSTKTGYDTWHGNPLNRVISLTIEKRW